MRITGAAAVVFVTSFVLFLSKAGGVKSSMKQLRGDGGITIASSASHGALDDRHTSDCTFLRGSR